MTKYNIYINDTLVAENVVGILMAQTVDSIANRFGDDDLEIKVKRVKAEEPAVEKVEGENVVPMPADN